MPLFTFFFLVLSLFFSNTQSVLAAVDKVEGYAWSSNMGWLSFNCNNALSCASSNYGVTLDRATGALDGYAWSSNLGWVSFNPTDVTGCPSAPCAPKIVGNALLGWAKVLNTNNDEGWTGWVHLKGSNYGVTFDGIKFSGYGWSDDVLGWLRFNPSIGPGVFSLANHRLTTGVSGGGANSSVTVESDVCTNLTCVFSYEQDADLRLLATPASGFVFDKWTGLNSSECPTLTAPSCPNIVLDADKEIKAQFKTINCPADGPGKCPVCNDGIDNDGDGKIDYPADSNCQDIFGTTETVNLPECSDCSDNDKDGKIDWTQDGGCNNSPGDANEINAVLDVSIILQGEKTKGSVKSKTTEIDCDPKCSHEYVDDERVTLTAIPGNKKSIFVEWGGGACNGISPSCTIAMTQSHKVTATFTSDDIKPLNCPADGPGKCPECNDGVDNDKDGKTDYPDDKGCIDLVDESEIDVPQNQCPAAGPGICPECNDGIDNDGDTKIDYPNDGQCISPVDDSESDSAINCPADGPGKCPQCNDGVDNDKDGKIDYPLDLGCFSRADNDERDPVIIGNCPADGPGKCPQCNDGIDNDKDSFVDWSGWDSDKDKVKDILRDPSCQGEPNKNNEAASIIIREF